MFSGLRLIALRESQRPPNQPGFEFIDSFGKWQVLQIGIDAGRSTRRPLELEIVGAEALLTRQHYRPFHEV